jgi:hypothetical protein
MTSPSIRQRHVHSLQTQVGWSDQICNRIAKAALDRDAALAAVGCLAIRSDRQVQGDEFGSAGTCRQ